MNVLGAGAHASTAKSHVQLLRSSVPGGCHHPPVTPFQEAPLSMLRPHAAPTRMACVSKILRISRGLQWLDGVSGLGADLTAGVSRPPSVCGCTHGRTEEAGQGMHTIPAEVDPLDTVGSRRRCILVAARCGSPAGRPPGWGSTVCPGRPADLGIALGMAAARLASASSPVNFAPSLRSG